MGRVVSPLGRRAWKSPLRFVRRNIVEIRVAGTRDRRKTVERGGFTTAQRVSTTNAADPVPVSDIKWSRACKLSHSAAEAPILAAARHNQPAPRQPSPTAPWIAFRISASSFHEVFHRLSLSLSLSLSFFLLPTSFFFFFFSLFLICIDDFQYLD